MRKIAILIFMFTAFATFAAAQAPVNGNVFFGYSYYSTDLSSIDRANTNGFEVSAEGHVAPFLGIVADFDGHYGSQNFNGGESCNGFNCVPNAYNGNFSEHNYLFGPRVGVPLGKFRPFAEFLIGAGHVNISQGPSDTSFATAFGGGFDYRLIRPLAWRVQGDYVHTDLFSIGQNNVRISTGIVLRF
jgi:opacity protein-like surface antigen